MFKSNSKKICQIDETVISANQELFIKFINILFILVAGFVITLIFNKDSEQLEWLIYMISALYIFLSSFLASHFINANKMTENSYRIRLLIDLFFLLLLVFLLFSQKILRLNHLLFMLLAFIPFIENYYFKSLNTHKTKHTGDILTINDTKDNHYFLEIILINILFIIAINSYFFMDIGKVIKKYKLLDIFKIITVVIVITFIYFYKAKCFNKINKVNPLIFLVFLLLVIFIIIQKPIDYRHYSFYVGPILDVIKGKSLLGDTPSLYGYLSIHFLAFILGKIGLSFDSFHLINTLLFCLFFLLACYIFFRLIKNRYLALLCSIVFITLQTLFSYSSDAMYPSTGPLRFGFGLLIIWFLSYKPRHLTFILGSIFASISLFWSVETAVYIIPAWIAVCLTYSYNQTDITKKFFKSSILRIILFLLISILIFFLIILKEYSIRHAFPNINNYFEYAVTYKNGLMAMPIPLYGNYYLAVITMVLGVVVTLHLITKKIKTTLLPLLSFISIHNIAIFSYFVSRSHENNIVNISGFIIIEIVIIIKVLIDVLKIDIILSKKMIAIPVILFVVLFAFRLSDQTIRQCELIKESLVKNMQSLFSPKTPAPILLNILTKYNLNNKPIAVLYDHDGKDTILLVESNLKNELPLNPGDMYHGFTNWQDKYIDPALNKLQAGTVIAVDEDISISSLNLTWEKILNKYNLKNICDIKEEKLIIYQIVSVENLLYHFGTDESGFITMLYNTILIRAPDKGGLNGWVKALDNKKITANQIVEGFIFSDEFNNKLINFSNKEYIYFLFKSLLYKIPDDITLSNYLNELNNGKTKKDILYEVLNSKEWEKICILFNVN